MDNTNGTPKKKKKMQAVRITFSNGHVGEFVGAAVVPEDQMEKVRITNVELGTPEEITDQIRESFKNDKDDAN